MAEWSVGSGGSSAPLATYTAPAGKVAVLKGLMAKPIVNASAALLEIHAGGLGSPESTIAVGYSTGGIIQLNAPDGLIRGGYVSADMTTNFTSTLASVLIWGDNE